MRSGGERWRITGEGNEWRAQECREGTNMLGNTLGTRLRGCKTGVEGEAGLGGAEEHKNTGEHEKRAGKQTKTGSGKSKVTHVKHERWLNFLKNNPKLCTGNECACARSIL